MKYHLDVDIDIEVDGMDEDRLIDLIDDLLLKDKIKKCVVDALNDSLGLPICLGDHNPTVKVDA